MNRSLTKVDKYDYGTTKPDLRLISGVVSRQHTTSPGLRDSERPVQTSPDPLLGPLSSLSATLGVALRLPSVPVWQVVNLPGKSGKLPLLITAARTLITQNLAYR